MNFLWQGNKEKKDYNLVNWKTGKIEGLWGSETWDYKMRACWFEVAVEGATLWKKVIIAKYVELCLWCIKNTFEPYGVGVDDNQKLVATNGRKYIYQGEKWFGRMVVLEWVKVPQWLGNGLVIWTWKILFSLASFWSWVRPMFVRWIDQTSHLSPDLFLICENSDARVCDCWTEQGWDISLWRSLDDWEVERVTTLLGKLGRVNIITIHNSHKQGLVEA